MKHHFLLQSSTVHYSKIIEGICINVVICCSHDLCRLAFLATFLNVALLPSHATLTCDVVSCSVQCSHQNTVMIENTNELFCFFIQWTSTSEKQYKFNILVVFYVRLLSHVCENTSEYGLSTV
jgi:hypothetical protein